MEVVRTSHSKYNKQIQLLIDKMIEFYLYQNKLMFQQLLAPRRPSQVIEFFFNKSVCLPSSDNVMLRELFL